MAFVVTAASGRHDKSYTSRPVKMQHLLPCAAAVIEPASSSGSYPSMKDSSTSAAPLSCGPEQTSFLTHSPGGSDSEGVVAPISGRRYPPLTCLNASTHHASGSESCSANSDCNHNGKDSNGSHYDWKRDSSSISDNKVLDWITRNEAINNTSEEDDGNNSSNTTGMTSYGNVARAHDSTSTSSYSQSSSNNKAEKSTGTIMSNDDESTDPTNGNSSLHYSSADPWRVGKLPPVTSSTDYGALGGDRVLRFLTADKSISEQHVRELRLLCRLIGLHSRPRLEKGQRVNVYLHGSSAASGKVGLVASVAGRVSGSSAACGPVAAAVSTAGLNFSSFFSLKRSHDNPLGLCPTEEIKVVGGVDIGFNTKCLFFLNDNEDHLYICFNWFDPKNALDVVSLSCRMATSFRLSAADTTSSSADAGTLDQLPFLEAARRSALAFWRHPDFQQLLQEAGAAARSPPSTAAAAAGNFQQDRTVPEIACRPPFRSTNFSSNLQAITCGGFSIGGPTAFYIAAILSAHFAPDASPGLKNGQKKIRAVAFGSPRFCGADFVRWSEQHLAPSSCSVILYSTAPHYQQQEHREQPYTQLQNYQHSWGGSNVKPSLTAAEGSEQRDGKIRKEQRMILDPVCVQGSAVDGFVVQPNPILLRVGGGLERMGKEHDEEAAAAAEEVKVKFSNVMWNMATRVSPFTKEYNNRYAMLHSVLRYYEALADT